jgi:hypothetical protein
MNTTAESEALHNAIEAFDIPLRMKQGMDEMALGNLPEVLRQCRAAWQHSDTIPKAAALELVDLAPAIESSSYLYDEDYAARVRDISIEIADLVRDCVS